MPSIRGARDPTSRRPVSPHGRSVRERLDATASGAIARVPAVPPIAGTASCCRHAGERPPRATTGAPFRERIPRDAIRAQLDLRRRPGRLRPAAVLPVASRRASIARAGARSCWARPPCGSATSPASGSTRSAWARSCCCGRWCSEMARRRPSWQVVDLHHHLHRAGGRPPHLSRTWSRSMHRWTLAGQPGAPSRGSGRRSWRWSSSSSGPT